MKLYFSGANKEEKLIATVQEYREVFSAIQHFLDEHNYSSYYIRTWTENDEIWYDVGSHTEFFILRK